MNHPILPLDEKNANGRIYPASELEKAVQQLAGKSLPGTIGYAEEGKVLEPAFDATNVRVEGNTLLADLTFRSQAAMALLKSGVAVVRPFGTGQVDEQGRVTDYTLQSLAIIPADQDAFKEEPGRDQRTNA